MGQRAGGPAEGVKPDSAVITHLPPPPDFFGKAGRVRTVSDLLENAQGQVLHLCNLKLVNGQDDDDKIPTGTGEPEGPTYGERITLLEAGIKALLGQNEDIYEDLIAEAVKRKDAKARRLEDRNRPDLQ